MHTGGEEFESPRVHKGFEIVSTKQGRASMDLIDWQWRYGIISRGMRVPSRPNDWFSPGQYAAIKIENAHLPGRIIEVIGDHPPIIKVCMYQGRKLCLDYLKGCKPTCRKYLFTTSDHAGILGLGDLLFVLENPELPESVDPRYSILAGQKAIQLFSLIDRLEIKQKCC